MNIILYSWTTYYTISLHKQKIQRETEQNNNNKSDLIQNKEPTCRLNWSEKRSRNKRSQIFSLPLFACDCYDFFLFFGFWWLCFFPRCCCLWWFKSKTVRMYYPECIKPISFNISLCIYLNICHYFARAFLYIYIAQGQADTKQVFVIILFFLLLYTCNASNKENYNFKIFFFNKISQHFKASFFFVCVFCCNTSNAI